MTIPQPKTRDDLIALLSITDPDELQALYDAAYAVKAAGVGRVVYYRGLVEFSNYCIKDCKYCGIRKSNDEVERFDTPREDILAMARWAWENRYGSLTLQSGERQDEEFIDYVEGLVRDIKALSHGELGLTLCVGEQTEETYRRWFDAGAHRYLLRIETSNPDLYATLHPLGRELGLKAGANVLMPIVTVPKYRPQYLLYDNKPCVDEVPDQCKNCLSARVASVGDTIGLGQWGDSPHFFHKK